MLFDDTYLTIEKPAEGVFRDRGSKFLAYAYPIQSEQDIKTLVAGLKQQHPKANHYCWAMRWSTDRSIFRINDDGEPSGTAGRPILNVLLSRNLTNVAVFVVRYFGGTLLGVPGLINAYKTAAELAVNEARVIEKTVNDVYTLDFEYLQINEVMRIVKDEDLEILEQHFDNSCSIKVAIRKIRVNQVLAKLEKLPAVIAKYEYSA
ncbi:MAG: YigZ family protein [Bacteroidetes bacterium]|nr:YigZ family protein [Bacteroidota bacterium]